MRRFIALLLLFAIGCPACFAGNGPDQKHVEKIKKQVGKYLEKDRMVSVETYDHRKMWGAVNEAGPDAFVLTVARTPTSIPYTNVKKIKAPMAPMDAGTRRLIIDGLVVAGVTVGLLVFTAIALRQD